LRPIVEDRLSQAGLDVWAPRVIREDGLLLTLDPEANGKNAKKGVSRR